jgi:aryl-alcohol dehydrogenase-like predicted oxidoreductase
MLVNGIKIVFGGAAFISGHTVADVEEWLKTLEELGIDTIDTAEGYGASELLLGQAGAAARFTIDTKVASGFGDTPATKEVVIKAGEASLQKLKTDTVSDTLRSGCPHF